MRRTRVFACLVLALAMATPMTVASADDTTAFITARPKMLTEVMSGVTATALLTVGEADPFPGWNFEAIPDGISVRVNGDDEIELYVNHETSKVPFPWGPLATVPVAPTATNSEADFDNSQVSKIIVDSLGNVISGEFAIPSSEGFQRFCSNFLATAEQGFTKDILFTNEESPDYVFREEDSWPPPMGDEDEEENGLVVALDVETGDYHPIYGMGRHNHENSVAIPGFDRMVLLSGDDTFTSGPLTIPAGGPVSAGTAPSQSQLYSYMAGNTKNVLADKGDLWAFVSDDPAVDDYYDFVPGSTNQVSGRFIKVPQNIATGKTKDGTEIQSEDVGFPDPPTDTSWQRDPRPPAGTSVGIDGPQWVLEYWGQLNNVFNFVRVEDIAYDKRPGMENVVYVVDSGRGTPGAVQPGRSTNGRVWKMVLDPDNPRNVESLSVFVEGDNNEVKTLDEIHQPDNLETTQTGLLVTEDPGSSQQFTAAQQISDAARATTARLWYVPFSGTPAVVAKVDQAQDGDVGIDVDGRPDGSWGAWESSGIVDASEAFGPGWFLIDVQAHTLWTQQAPGDDDFPPAGPDLTKKREGGQLLKIYIPATIPA
jgi:hypothetical protein